MSSPSPLHHGVQTAAPMFSVRSLTCQAASARRRMPSWGELDVDPFGGHQRLVLIGQGAFGSVRMRSEVFGGQGGQLDPDRQTALQLGDEVGRLWRLGRRREATNRM